MATVTQQLVEVRLGRDLATYVNGLRSAGLSWREIADDVHQRTGVQVSYEALRSWYRDGERAEAGA